MTVINEFNDCCQKKPVKYIYLTGFSRSKLLINSNKNKLLFVLQT